MTQPALDHPAWCVPATCTAAENGMHLSASMPANPAGDEVFGLAVHLVLFARLNQAHTLVVLEVTADDETVQYLMDRRQAATLRTVLGDALLVAGRTDEKESELARGAAEPLSVPQARAQADVTAEVVQHEGRTYRVIPSALHDIFCRARVGTPQGTPQGTTPEVLGCALCGFCYPLANAAPSADGRAGR
jgi:hypothetical protein